MRRILLCACRSSRSVSNRADTYAQSRLISEPNSSISRITDSRSWMTAASVRSLHHLQQGTPTTPYWCAHEQPCTPHPIASVTTSGTNTVFAKGSGQSRDSSANSSFMASSSSNFAMLLRRPPEGEHKQKLEDKQNYAGQLKRMPKVARATLSSHT